MEIITYTNAMPFTYDPTHRGAPYRIAGRYKNHGEFCESVVKYHRGLEYAVNPNTRYDKDSDLPQENASIKSSGATLADVFGNDKPSILATYMARVHSSKWIWVVDIEDTIQEYHMNKAEFTAFAETFTSLAIDSGTHLQKLRFKHTSNKMLRWLNDKAHN